MSIRFWGSYSEYAGGRSAMRRHIFAMAWGRERLNFPKGILAQTVIKPEDKVDLGFEASMIVTFREVLSAIRRFQFQPNESVLVLGAGPVGLCFTKFSKLLGLRTVITTGGHR